MRSKIHSRRSVEGSDDYAALAEVLRRRLSRGLREETLPDFILIDGGKGQLGVLTAVLAELELSEQIDCAGIAEASRVLAQGPVDLVTTALVLPDGDGLALARRVREAAGQAYVPVIVVSGSAQETLELRAFTEGFSFSAPTMPIYSNLNGQPLSVDDLPAHLEQHMISPVRWKALVENGVVAGLTTGCEIGPGKTLTGFARKISKELAVTSVETMENVLSAAQ